MSIARASSSTAQGLEAANVIERRASSRELRIGIEPLTSDVSCSGGVYAVFANAPPADLQLGA